MALHVRGVVLPDDKVRDLWLDGDRVTLEPVPGAQTVSTTGFILPGLVDAHCHIGIRPGGGPIADIAEARELAGIDRAAGVLAIRDAGSPFRYPRLDDDPEVAHAAGARVAVHTFGEQAVATFVRAGVDSVEHGTGLSLNLIDEMARRGTTLTPTMINIQRFDDIAAQAEPKFPAYAAHIRALRAGFPAVVRAAYEAGVPIHVGSDAGGGIAHGMAAREMLLLHELAGMTPLDVLQAGSWGAREWLGFPGLVEGGLADLVVYESDPRRDLAALLSPGRIVLRGRVTR